MCTKSEAGGNIDSSSQTFFFIFGDKFDVNKRATFTMTTNKTKRKKKYLSKSEMPLDGAFFLFIFDIGVSMMKKKGTSPFERL